MTAAIVAWVGSWFLQNALRLMWILAAIGVVLSVLFMIRKGGADGARLEMLEGAIDAVKKRRQIERDMRGAKEEELNRWLRPPPSRR